MTTETAHQTLALGAKVLANTAVKIFSDEEKVAAMERDFLEG